MIILAIEATCDDTSFAILKNNKVISFVKKTQIIHQNYNGVIPELAARYHFKEYNKLLEKVMFKANLIFSEIDVVAYSAYPGLPSCLHICRSLALSIGYILDIPIIPVDHLWAHLFSSFINKDWNFLKLHNSLGLIMSGGHTNLYLVNNLNPKLIGESLDDAVGECFDKVAVILNLSFPWGSNIEKLAKGGELKFNFSLPKKNNFNFSYSGLKTEVLKLKKIIHFNDKTNLAYSFQHYAFLQIIQILRKAVVKFKINNIFFGGGVVQNKYFKKLLKDTFKNQNIKFYFPLKKYCSDNAAMIGYLAWLKSLKDN